MMTTLKPYTTSTGTNLAAALASGKVTPQQLEDVGFDNSTGGAIQTAEQYNALQAILDNPKNNIKTSAGYQINVALANKNLTVSDLTALGFQQPAITQAQAYNVILNKMGLPATTLSILDKTESVPAILLLTEDKLEEFLSKLDKFVSID